MTEALKFTLERLRDATNAALAEARGAKLDGAINWADLKCGNAVHFEDVVGDEGYQVWINEASPDAYGLHAFVAERLKAAGFAHVEIHTEW